MDNRHWPYDPHEPRRGEPDGWVVAGEEEESWPPPRNGQARGARPESRHADPGWPPATPPHQAPPERWYGDGAYGEQYGAGPPAGYPPSPPPQPYQPHYRRPRGQYEQYGQPPAPSPADQYPYPAAREYPPGPPRAEGPGWAAGPTRPPTRRPRGRTQPAQPAGVDEEQPEVRGASWLSVLGWLITYFAAPVLLYLGWALTRSDIAPVDCVDATGAPCLPPREEAIADFVAVGPALAGAFALALLTSIVLRRLTTAWRASTVGFAAAIIGAGMATLVAKVVG